MTQDELLVSSRRRGPTIVWFVELGDDLYIRSVNGRGAAWFRGVLETHEGTISIGGVERDVAFEETTEHADALDAAYREKYAREPRQYVDAINSAEARAATLRVVPRGQETR